MQRADWSRLLEQLERISPHACERCQRYVCSRARSGGLTGFRLRSDAVRSKLCNLAAPLQGPEFWRIIIEDPARRQKNVTLLWKVRTMTFRFFTLIQNPLVESPKKGVQQAHASLGGKLGWSLLMGLCMHLGYDLICATDTCLANTRAGRGCRWLLMVILQHKVRWFCCPCSAWLVLYSLLVLLLPPSSFLFLFSVAFPADSWHTLL